MPQASNASRSRGFTVLELMTVVLIMALLVALAIPGYQMYVERALAQLLLQIDQISTAVQIEDATGRRGLQRGALPGWAPPRLKVVPDESFRDAWGLRLLLIRAPAGFFASSPDTERYGLIVDIGQPADPAATSSTAASASKAASAVAAASAPTADSQAYAERRVALLRDVLPFDVGDKIWVAPNMLAFPLVNRAAPGGSTVPPTGGGGWEGGGELGPNNTWTCKGTVSVYGTDGQLLTGVNAGVRIRVVLDVTTWNGEQIERSWDDLGNLSGGQASFSVDGLSANASNGEVVTGCRLEVTGVDYYYPTDPAVKWDGNKPSLQVDMPTGSRSAAAPAANKGTK